MGIDLEGWKTRIRTAVDELRGQLLATSHDIHANPELLFKEHRASARLADELDMGDISQILPAVHAYFAIVPESIANHTVEFATAAASPAGDAAVLDGAATLAMTAAELLSEPSLVAQAKADFDRQLAAGEVAGRETWLARGREYTGAGATAE